MSKAEANYYNILSTQSNYLSDRAKTIETKAFNVIVFTGVVIGLEYTLLYNFSSNILVENKDYLFYLIALSTSLFFSSILLGIITFLESHNLPISKILCSNECNEQKIIELTQKIENGLYEHECKVKSKERYFKSSLVLFILGILVVIVIFNSLTRYSVHS